MPKIQRMFFSLLRNQFWCFRKCNKITAIYNCTKVNIDCRGTAKPLQRVCSAIAMPLQFFCRVSAKVHFGAHYMRTGCAARAHIVRMTHFDKLNSTKITNEMLHLTVSLVEPLYRTLKSLYPYCT